MRITKSQLRFLVVAFLMTSGCGHPGAESEKNPNESEISAHKIPRDTEMELSSARVPTVNLPIFRNAFPKPVAFRPEGFRDGLATQNVGQNSAEAWTDLYKNYLGLIGKGVEDEFRQIPGGNFGKYLEHLLTYKRRYQDRLVLVHHNGNGLNPNLAEVRRNFRSADFWLYHPGTNNAFSLPKGSDKICIPLGTASRFRDGLSGRCAGRSHQTPQCVGDDITIVSRKLNDRDYKTFEHAVVTRIQANVICPHSSGKEKSDILTVKRGAYGSDAQKFGPLYVAPHVLEGPYGNADKSAVKIWVVNYARGNSHAPQTAHANVLASYFQQNSGQSGEQTLEELDGITLDVSDNSISTLDMFGRAADFDLNGIADNGIVNGVDRWRQGRADFYRILRQLLPDRMIIADGNASFHQRSIAHLDGIEAEKLTPEDMYLSAFSTGINRITYWHDRPNPVGGKRSLNYVVNKIPAEYRANPNKSRPYLRMLMAYATILGMGVGQATGDGDTAAPLSAVFPTCNSSDLKNAGMYDEMSGGKDAAPQWLGAPKGPIRRLALQTPDQLQGHGRRLTDRFLKQWKHGATLGVRRVIPEEADTPPFLQLRAKSDHSGRNMYFVLSDVHITPGQDITLALEVQAARQVPFIPERDAYSSTPREIKVKVLDESGLAANQKAVLSGLMGITGHGGFRRQVFTFRMKANHSLTQVSLGITAEGTEPVQIRRISVHSHADVMVREFENGVVLANMSAHSAARFDLAQLFPKKSLQRLRATSCQDDGVNNGANVTAKQLTLKPESGLFLRSDPTR